MLSNANISATDRRLQMLSPAALCGRNFFDDASHTMSTIDNHGNLYK